MKTNFALAFFLLLSMYYCYNPENPQQIARKHAPLVLVIGFDRSLSMGSATLADTSDIRRICEVLLRYDQPATLGFEVIGAPSDRKFLRLDLLPQFNQKTPSLSKLAMLSDSNVAVRAENRRRVEVFIRACQQRLEETSLDNQFTDLNGFLAQSGTFISELQLRDYRKMILCHSDGRHDTVHSGGAVGSRDLETRCPEWPSNSAFYVCNWEADTSGCNIDGVFESMEGFHQFFQQQLK